MEELLTPEVKVEGILPNSRLKEDKKVIFWPNGMKLVPLYCANCGVDSGSYVLESEWDSVKNFACYLCDERQNNCAAKWSPLLGVYMTPDEVFWTKLRNAQIEKFGRELTGPEIIEALKDENHIISKLAKERPQ